MSNSPDSKLPTPEPNSEGAAQAAGQPAGPVSPTATLNVANVGGVSKSLPNKSNTIRKSRKKFYIAGGAAVLATLGISVLLLARPDGPRADVILHKVKREPLNVSVTEKGTLESSANTDIPCKVRAGSKGYATTVNWVVEDGTRVNPGDPLMILDDSALEDSQKDEEIKVVQALGDKLLAEKDYEIQLKTNEINIAKAQSDLLNFQIALEKLLGYEVDASLVPLGAVAGAMTLLKENGSYRQQLDDLTGKITQALSDVEQNRERSAWSDRMVKQAYMSPAQAEADRSRLESSLETLRSQRAAKAILMNYDRKVQIAKAATDRDNALKGLEKAILEARANAEKALTTKTIKNSVYDKESDKLADIRQQRDYCRIYAPDNIRPGSMVVYFKPETNRFGSQTQALIEQGAQMKEGQKMLRIPNLEKMQVNTKIHEAMVSRVHGDNRVPTRFIDLIQVGMYTNTNLLSRAFTTRQTMVDLISTSKVSNEETEEMAAVHDLEFKLKERGQRAIVRIDAMPDKRYLAHVKSISAVANQNDVMMSDVKLYPTIVIVDKEIVGTDEKLAPVSGEVLKPDMTAEVTISVDASKEPVLTIPLQAIIGGAELGAPREVFVKSSNGYELRMVMLGLFNDRVVEVREGLNEGDEVVTNPKVLIKDTKAKTGDPRGQKTGKGGEGKGSSKEAGGETGTKKKGGGPPPAGAAPKG